MTGDQGECNSGTSMEAFDYELPEELIAQVPLEDRLASRLLVIDRASGELTHASFADLAAYLRPGDLLVLNDSRVIPARLVIRRASGGRGELLLLHKQGAEGEWVALARPMKRLKAGEEVHVTPLEAGQSPARATILEKLDASTVRIRLDHAISQSLDVYGHVPLPPYIHSELSDPERYQTVYGQIEGSAAAPTAGLHFTTDMLEELERRGVEITRVTLHVGLDTFRPVMEDIAEDHEIHSEWCSVDQDCIDAIRSCRQRGGRVIAVGTTSARTLETLARRSDGGDLEPFAGATDIYITPGYRWKMVDGLITNFHLPKSTLILMVSSFAGRELILRAYREAIERRYRFFSFGDATLIV